MSRGWEFSSGDWWITCDVCAKKVPASQTKHRWDGLVVCKDDYEVRHSMDFIKTKQDKITVPFTRPKAPNVFKLPKVFLYVDAGYPVIDYVEGDIIGLPIDGPNYFMLYIDDSYMSPQDSRAFTVDYFVED